MTPPEDDRLTPAERERLQLDVIARWEARRPCERQRRLQAARQRSDVRGPREEAPAGAEMVLREALRDVIGERAAETAAPDDELVVFP